MPYYERVSSGIDKSFSKIFKHRDMAEMGLQSRTFKEFTILEVIAEHIQSGNYGSSSKRNQKKMYPLLCNGLDELTTTPLSEHKGIIRNNDNPHSTNEMMEEEDSRTDEIGSSPLWVISWRIFWHYWLSKQRLLSWLH